MKADGAAYVILGRGRWAGVIRNVLSGEKRRIATIEETRRRTDEDDRQFKDRVGAALIATGAQIAWICVLPCAEVPLLVESAVCVGLHVIVEKPWLYSQAETEALVELSRSCRKLVAVHFQYCFLGEVEELKALSAGIKMARFSGTFTLSRDNRLGLPALENLGSHLFAVQEYAVPGSEVSAICCDYCSKDERRVQVEFGTELIVSIDLMTKEPIIQRFASRFEEAASSLEFPHGLQFAMRVSNLIKMFRQNNVAC